MSVPARRSAQEMHPLKGIIRSPLVPMEDNLFFDRNESLLEEAFQPFAAVISFRIITNPFAWRSGALGEMLHLTQKGDNHGSSSNRRYRPRFITPAALRTARNSTLHRMGHLWNLRSGQGRLSRDLKKQWSGCSQASRNQPQFRRKRRTDPYRDELTVEVKRSDLPADLDPEIGQRLQLENPEGKTIVVLVTDVNESGIRLDANHPLAGKGLVFEISLVEITEANVG